MTVDARPGLTIFARWTLTTEFSVSVDDPPNLEGHPLLVYLDVWQREVTHLPEPELVEQAVGVDSTGRVQTVWQVKVLDVDEGVTCATADGQKQRLEITRPSGSRSTPYSVCRGGFDAPFHRPPQ